MAERVEATHESLRSLLCNGERDFFIRNNGDKVKVEELEGKHVGLYFSAHWCPPCRGFTPVLSEIYTKLSEKGDFEILFVSADLDEKSFKEYHHTMPWLALPFSDSNTRKKLNQSFQVDGIPCLVFLDREGRVITTEGVEIIKEFGVEGYPFTAERFAELRAKEEALRAAQTVDSLLLSDERDFVLGHEGRKVPVAELVGKTVGLYFSAHWCGPCRNFTPQLVEIYNELLKKGEAFEIVFLSTDIEEKDFEEYYASMPWLALPFGDNAKKYLSRYFRVQGIPTLIILGPDGKTVLTDAVSQIREYGIRAYPFTKERLDELEAEEKAKREAQTLESLLVSDERNFVIKHGGAQVPVVELVGKTVGLYFSAHWCGPCRKFTPELVDIYNKLLKKGEAFEIVFLSGDKEEKDFEEYYASMQWLALPFGDKAEKNLSRYFGVQGIPSLIILGPDGKTVQTNAVGLIREYGIRAYPFTKKRMDELEAEDEAKREAQTLESLLVSDERNFVIKHGGAQVPVVELVGKTIALYFSAHWCPPCQGFTPKLVKVYNELKERGEAFEIVFISIDKDEEAFEDYYNNMPWLALPFGDETKKDLMRLLRVTGIPSLIVVGPDGKTVTENAESAVTTFGAKAYPFTDAHLETLQKEMEKEMKELAEKSPKEIRYSQHEHPLVLTEADAFICDVCDEDGTGWSYYCKDCDYSVHLTCALKDEGDLMQEDKGQDTDAAIDENCKPEGVICDGDVCYKMAEA